MQSEVSTKSGNSQPVDSRTHSAIVSCINCNATNASGNRFCSDCGSSLTINCPSCDTEILMGEKFCGTCGDSVASKSQEALKEAKRLLGQARTELEQSAFDAAATALARICGDKYVADSVIAVEARELAIEVEERKTVAMSDRTRLLCRAREQHENGNEAKVIELLGSIPEALRDSEISKLLEKSSEYLLELERLEDQVEAAFAGKATLDHMHIADRLLKLVPDHSRATELGEKLRDQVCKRAKALFTKADFDKATEMLNVVPQRFRDETFRQMSIVVRDFRWMQTYIRNATHVDRTLVESANRTLKRFPDHESLAPLIPELRKRHEEDLAERNLQLKSWARHEKPSRFNAKVNFLDFQNAVEGFEQFLDSRTPFAATFSTATGLALGGLSNAKYALHLTGGKKKFSLGRIGIGGAKHTNAIGLDIGRSCVRAVKVSCEEGTPKVEQVEQVELNLKGNSLENKAHRNETVIALKKLQDKLSLGSARIVSAIPDFAGFFRLLQLPKVDKKDQEKALDFEIEHQIPFPMDAVTWSHHVFSNEERFEGMLFAAKREQVESLAMTFTLAGMNVPVIQSSGIALLNLLDRKLKVVAKDEPRALETAVGLICFGDTSTTLCIEGPGRSIVRTLGFRSDKLTRSISSELNLTYDQALKVKHEPWLLPRVSELYRAIGSDLETLDRELELNITAIEREYPELVPSVIYCTGGGSLLSGMLQVLRKGPEVLVS